MLTEREGCAILAEVFAARGYSIARDVRFDERGLRFDIDGWDAAARVGFEFRTHEAGDHIDLSDAELGDLARRIDAGDLHVFVIDDLAVEDAADLRSYARHFLDEVERRRGESDGPATKSATKDATKSATKTATKKTIQR